MPSMLIDVDAAQNRKRIENVSKVKVNDDKKMISTNLLMSTSLRRRFKIEKNFATVMSIVDRRRCARMSSFNFLNF